MWGNKIYNDTENLGCRVISCCVRSMKERTKNIRGSDEMEKIRTQKVITFTRALSISERKILQLSAIVVLLSLLQGLLRGSFN